MPNAARVLDEPIGDPPVWEVLGNRQHTQVERLRDSTCDLPVPHVGSHQHHAASCLLGGVDGVETRRVGIADHPPFSSWTEPEHFGPIAPVGSKHLAPGCGDLILARCRPHDATHMSPKKPHPLSCNKGQPEADPAPAAPHGGRGQESEEPGQSPVQKVAG